MSLSIRQLRYFVATAELGQVSQAAIDLAISQSAITAAIKELEEIIGTPLFIRMPRGMELTSAGRKLLSQAYEVLRRLDELTHLSSMTDDLEGTLTVAATYTVIGYFLPAHIARLRRQFPKLEYPPVRAHPRIASRRGCSRAATISPCCSPPIFSTQS